MVRKRKRKTHCKRGHPFSGDNVRIAVNGQQICRECSRQATRRHEATGTKKRYPPKPRVRKERVPKNKNTDLACRKKFIINRVRGQARVKGREFDITVNDLTWPTHCPILGTELDYFFRRGSIGDVPSLDRIDTTRGYVKGNVKVISYRANTRKGDMTFEDIKRLFEYVQIPQALAA